MKKVMLSAALVLFLAVPAAGSELYTAAKKGDRANVEALLKGGADANGQDADGYTPLWSAAFYGRKEVA